MGKLTFPIKDLQLKVKCWNITNLLTFQEQMPNVKKEKKDRRTNK